MPMYYLHLIDEGGHELFWEPLAVMPYAGDSVRIGSTIPLTIDGRTVAEFKVVKQPHEIPRPEGWKPSPYPRVHLAVTIEGDASTVIAKVIDAGFVPGSVSIA